MKVTESQVLNAFSALSQQTRLRMLRELVKAGPKGLAAGAISEKAGTSPSNASFHLAALEAAGLISSRRESRSIVYSANYSVVSGLADFLMKDCCKA